MEGKWDEPEGKWDEPRFLQDGCRSGGGALLIPSTLDCQLGDGDGRKSLSWYSCTDLTRDPATIAEWTELRCVYSPPRLPTY